MQETKAARALANTEPIPQVALHIVKKFTSIVERRSCCNSAFPSSALKPVPRFPMIDPLAHPVQ